MKTRVHYLSLAALIAVTALSVTACGPAFFTGSNVSDPARFQTTALMPNGEGLTQMVIAPGTLAIGAANSNRDVKIYCCLFGDGSRRLQIWDYDTDTYVDINDDLTRAATLVKQYIEFRPNISPTNVTMWWSFMMNGSTEAPDKPILNIDSSDVVSLTDIGTILQFKIKHEYDDSNAGVVHTFRSAGYDMTQDRIGYVRVGDVEANGRPQILDINVTDGETAVPTDREFHLYTTERLGNFQAMLVNQGDSVSDPSDNIYHTMAVIDETIDGTTYDYKLGMARSLANSTDYYWTLLVRTDGDNAWPTSGDDMPITQDLHGNSIQDSNTLFHTTGSGPMTYDLGDIMGGSANNVRVYYLKFTTAAP